MADPFVAEIRIFPFSFAPKGWAFCAGQILPISQNTALFSLLGTVYGGDGKSTFALPDMQGNSSMFWGQGSGLSLHDLGETSGSQFVTLIESEMPAHNHLLQANNANSTSQSPTTNNYSRGLYSFAGDSGAVATYTTAAPDTQMNPFAISVTGGSLPHNNMMPYLTLNFCIALQGVFPPRG
jgi:microcystin-dependent protein